MKDLIKKILKEEQDLEWAKDLAQSEVRPSRSLILKKQKDLPKNAIETHTEVMHGDGDSYDNDIVIYYRNGAGTWGKGYTSDEPNFEDFERVIDFLRGNHQIDWDNDEETEFFVSCGIIDDSEYADNGYEIGSINKVFYYDENGNKFEAKIDGVTTHHDDDDDDGRDFHEDECEMCGDIDDTGTGVCSDCEGDEWDDDDDE